MSDKPLVFLVVDDEPEVRATIVGYLAAMGHPGALEAEDGYQALKIMNRTQVSFVLSDWEMPGINGLELLKILKQDDEGRTIPFIMVTSPTSQERTKIEEAALSQVDAYLIKPFRAETLRTKVEEVLAARRAEPPRKAALVVDDDDAVRSTVVEYVKAMGYDPVLEAKDGEQGLKVIQDHPGSIEIVLSDWEMPRMSGIELLRHVREVETFEHLPFVMVTSQTSVEHLKLQAAIRAEVDHYLMKPFTLKALREKIELVLCKSRLARKVSSRVRCARSAMNIGDQVTAEKLFQHILELDPRCVDALIGLAQIRLRKAPKRGFDEAIYFVKRAIELSPRLDRVHLELSKIYEGAMSLDKAIQVTQAGIRDCPPSLSLQLHLARLLVKRGKREEAVAAAWKALEIDSSSGEAAQLIAELEKGDGP